MLELNMEEDKLIDYLDGFCAYSQRALDSGIKDTKIEKEIKTYLRSLDDVELSKIVFQWLYRYCSHDERVHIQAGYSIKDIRDMLSWFIDDFLNE